MSSSRTDAHLPAPLIEGGGSSGLDGAKVGPSERAIEQHASQVTPIPEDENFATRRPRWVGTSSLLDGVFGEFLGTMILVMFGEGATAQFILSGGTKGSYQSMSWGWG